MAAAVFQRYPAARRSGRRILTSGNSNMKSRPRLQALPCCRRSHAEQRAPRLQQPRWRPRRLRCRCGGLRGWRPRRQCPLRCEWLWRWDGRRRRPCGGFVLLGPRCLGTCSTIRAWCAALISGWFVAVLCCTARVCLHPMTHRGASAVCISTAEARSITHLSGAEQQPASGNCCFVLLPWLQLQALQESAHQLMLVRGAPVGRK